MTDKITAAEYREIYATQTAQKAAGGKAKYKNVKTTVDGIVFDSKKEAQYYGLYKLLSHQKKIKDFQRQVRFRLMVNKQHVCDYFADFVIDENDGTRTVVDVKSNATAKLPVFLLKYKLMKACLGITVKIVN